MVFYRVDYEQRRINEQITVPKHTWKEKANATPMVQMKKSKKNIYIYIYISLFHMYHFSRLEA